MDNFALLKEPISSSLKEFDELFNDYLSHSSGLLSLALEHVKKRSGKRMRPVLIMLIANALGQANACTQNAAAALELLHTASLVHDDVVDESKERRGQPSVNAVFDNRVAILVGDYILSTSLLAMSKTDNLRIVNLLSELGRTLSQGELLQLEIIDKESFSEDAYYSVIKQKTASLFEACSTIGALSVNSDEEIVEKARLFGLNLGMAFQIRDDIFDYFDSNIGKPTGNDMLEGKLTLPAIHAVLTANDPDYTALALKIKKGSATADEIAQMVAFTKQNGGIEYAEMKMQEYACAARTFIQDCVSDEAIKRSLNLYLDFVVGREI